MFSGFIRHMKFQTAKVLAAARLEADNLPFRRQDQLESH